MSRRPSARHGLGERGLALLGDLGRLRFATGQHLARLHFPTGTAVGRQRRAQAALQRLSADGYLHRLPRRVGGAASGSQRFVYQLGYRGQKAVWPNRRARTPEETGWSFVEHSLAISDLVVDLVEDQRGDRDVGLSFETEPKVWRRYIGPSGRSAVLKPDLFIRLAVNGREQVWFVELDRATEGLKRIRTKASQYMDYWRSGREQERLGVFPRVLWSVPDDQRARAIARTLEQLPEPAAAMFAVATHQHARCALRVRDDEDNNEEGGEK